MRRLDGLAKRGPFALALVRGIEPFGQIGKAREGALDGALHVALVEPFGEPVHGLDGGQLLQPLFIEHLVGVNHLQMAFPQFELARNPAPLAQRQHLSIHW